MSDIRRVLVVGGGVGGLTAAASFARRGAEVLLIERRPAFDVPGVGLGQPANALRVCDALGLLPDILASGFAYDRMYIFDHNRQLIVEHKFLLGDAKVPAFCALSRLRLHEILLAAAERAGVAVEPILVPWPWFRGRVVIGGDAAHTSPPHLTQGAAMAAEDGYVLAREVLDGDGPLEARLLRYSQARYARSAFVYSFSYQWMLDEQSVRTPTDLEAARKELALNASTRIGASDRILDARVI
jgi:2-polyprenyl-6-methoxyphenol hydroxylase-like FAD-dependent oxidoreductase